MARWKPFWPEFLDSLTPDPAQFVCAPHRLVSSLLAQDYKAFFMLDPTSQHLCLGSLDFLYWKLQERQEHPSPANRLVIFC